MSGSLPAGDTPPMLFPRIIDNPVASSSSSPEPSASTELLPVTLAEADTILGSPGEFPIPPGIGGPGVERRGTKLSGEPLQPPSKKKQDAFSVKYASLFERLDKDFVKCKECDERLRTNKGYKTLQTHPCYKRKIEKELSINEDPELRAALKRTLEPDGRSGKGPSRKLKAMFQHADNKITTNLIAEMVVVDGVPLSIVEKRGFLKLLAHLTKGNDPSSRYVPPSRRTIGRIIDRRLAETIEGIPEKLADRNCIAITTDIWTRPRKESVVSILAHSSPVQDCRPTDPEAVAVGLERITMSHTSENISQMLLNALGKLQLASKVKFVISDSARSMLKTHRLLQQALPNLAQSYPCAGHLLHLVVCNGLSLYLQDGAEEADHNSESDDLEGLEDDTDSESSNDESDDVASDDSLEEDDEEWVEGADEAWLNGIETEPTARTKDRNLTTKKLVDKVRAIIVLLRRSSLARDIMSKIRGLPGSELLSFPMDVRTRWNSTYAMLKDFYANREWYKKFLKDAPKHVKPNSPIYTTCKSCKLKDTEYGLILAICNTLEPLNDATKLLSASNFSTLTQLHEVISMLKLFLRSSETKSTYVKRLQGNLLFQLEKYFEYITTDDFILAAAYLNADTRRSTYSEELKVDNGIGRSSVIQCIKRLKISSKFVSLPVAKPNRQSCKGEKKSTSAFFDFMNNQICSDLASESMADGEGANLEPGDVDEERLQSLLSEYERRARTYPTPQEHDSQPIPDGIAGSRVRNKLFWFHNKDLDELFTLSTILTGVPATSVSSESCFSVAGALSRARRSRLTANRLRSLVILRGFV